MAKSGQVPKRENDGIIGSGYDAPIAFQLPHVEQSLLFPRRTLCEFPKQKNSADSLGEVEAEDLHRYYIKGDSNGQPTRASEWLCTQLAETIGIAAPPVAVIELANGNLVFGSRRISGVADDIATQLYLTRKTEIGPNPSNLSSLLSMIYTFDMFVNNDDRHFGNYLTVEENGTRRLFAFDFSRAMFWRWPWVNFPSPNQNTRVCGKILRSSHGFDINAAREILGKLKTLSPAIIEGFLNRMPSEWLSGERKKEFMNMWSGVERQDRIGALHEGFGDGSLL
jgi:hypothetical protein